MVPIIVVIGVHIGFNYSERTPEHTSQSDLFRNELVNLTDNNHELFQLAYMISWSIFEMEFGLLHSIMLDSRLYPLD